MLGTINQKHAKNMIDKLSLKIPRKKAEWWVNKNFIIEKPKEYNQTLDKFFKM